MTAEHAFDTPDYQATSARLAAAREMKEVAENGLRCRRFNECGRAIPGHTILTDNEPGQPLSGLCLAHSPGGYLAGLPDHCPGYECEEGRTWTEAHRNDPGDPGFVPGHFWHSDGSASYMAHHQRTDTRTNGCDHAAGDGCYRCCPLCNYDRHTCPGCGVNLQHGQTACAACHASTDLERAAGARIAEQILEQRPFTQPAPVTPAEAATASTLPDLPAPTAAVDLDQLADPAPLAWYKAIEGWDAEIVALEDQIAPLKEKRDRASEIIQAAMGDAAEARIAGRPAITWKPSAPAMRLDRDALERDHGAGFVARYLRPAKAARPFKILPPRAGA